MENRCSIFYVISRKSITLFLLFIICSRQANGRCRGRESSESLSSSTPSRNENRPQRIALSIFFGSLTGFIGALLFACLLRCFLWHVNRTPNLKGPVVFSPKVEPITLQLALANENQLLGSSPNGKYYRTVLDNGLAIAVKRIETLELASNKFLKRRRIQQELETVASLRHPNLMSLRAFYLQERDGFFSLVYDYMPAGSLEDALNRVRENQMQLSWEVRHRIAVGLIKGLQYLHFSCIPQILHYNLKPTNVLLDAQLKAKLADCGLTKLLPNLDRAASRYSAPECLVNGRYTDKSDVFSFGMILALLLTGRDPMDPFFEEAGNGRSMGRWLRNLQEAGEARQALDKRILGEEIEEDEMLMAARIASGCLSDSPADRPSSDELVPMLTQLHSF